MFNGGGRMSPWTLDQQQVPDYPAELEQAPGRLATSVLAGKHPGFGCAAAVEQSFPMTPKALTLAAKMQR